MVSSKLQSNNSKTPNSNKSVHDDAEIGPSLALTDIPITSSSASASPTSSSYTDTKGAKKLGVMDGAKFLASYVIGAGIFTTVTNVYVNVRNMWLTIGLWIVCGFLCLVGALCYAELASILPGSGGEHIYMTHGYGNIGMRVFDWMSFLVLRPTSVAFYAMKFTAFFMAMFPLSQAMPGWAEILGATLFITVITAFSIVAPSAFDKAQKFFTYTKIIGLVSVVILGIAVLIKNPSILVANATVKATFDNEPKNLAQAFSDAILTFDGWNAINPIAGRFHNPSTVIPKSIMFGTSFIIMIYLLVVLANFFIQNDFTKGNQTVFVSIMQELISSNANVGTKIGKFAGNPIICLAVFSATQAAISSSVDTFESAVADGSLPPWLMAKSAVFGTHHLMLGLQSLIAILWVVASVLLQTAYNKPPSQGSDHASQLSVLTFCIFYVFSVAVIVMEMFRKKKLKNNGYKVFKPFPFIFLLATIGLVVLMIVMNFQQGMGANGNPAIIIVNFLIFGLFMACLLVAIFVDKAKAPIPAKTLKLEEEQDELELMNLDRVAVIPPQVVESALLGSAVGSQLK